MLPDDVHAIPQPERAKSAKFDEDFCTFGKRNFVRCVLILPFTMSDGYFGYGAWAEVDDKTFMRSLNLAYWGGPVDPPGAGKIANRFASYPQAYGLGVVIIYGPKGRRPLLAVDEDGSELASDQLTGIGAERYHRILVEEKMI